MSALSDIVAVTITSSTANPTQAGFGVPLIVSNTAAWTERVRTYNSIADVVVDFATTTAEYKMAAKVFAQNPRPPTLLIGRAALPATLRFRLTPVVINSYTYRWKVNGNSLSFTSDASATAAEIIAGIKAATDALALAITTSDQTTYLRAVANAAGVHFAFSSSDPNLQLLQDHVDPGIATDLAAIALENNEWYFLLTSFNSKDLVVAAAAWCETSKKQYYVQTCDGAVPNTTDSGGDDTAEALETAGYEHSTSMYSKANDDFLDCAICGRIAPILPGGETNKFKTLASVDVGVYTPTQRANMRAKHCNFYENTAGVAMYEEGYVAAGTKFTDFVRYLDYLQARIAEGVFAGLASGDKLPYNDRGIAVVQAKVYGQLLSDEKREALLPGSIVTVPKVADVSSADKTARVLNNVTFTAAYAGAIHKVNISGTVVAG